MSSVPHFTKRPKLGETLRFFGLLSGAEVEIALGRQVNEGGRLGTCLLDTGLVDEATLLAALGAQQNVATVDAATLAAVPASANAPSCRRARRWWRVPCRSPGPGARLEVAMLDPGSLRLIDELSAVSRMVIVPAPRPRGAPDRMPRAALRPDDLRPPRPHPRADRKAAGAAGVLRHRRAPGGDEGRGR